MAHRVEELGELAVNEESRGDRDEILQVDLSLSPIGRDVQLFNDIGGGVRGDDERLGCVIAFRISTVITISHTRKEVEDETRGGVESSVVLSDAGSTVVACACDVRPWTGTNKRHTKAIPCCHHIVVSFDNSRSLMRSERLDSILVLS